MEKNKLKELIRSYIRGRCMKVSYNKLWKMLIDKKMNKNALRHAVGMSPNTMAKMGRDENVSMDVLVRICEVLKCDIGDIMEMIPDAEEEKEG